MTTKATTWASQQKIRPIQGKLRKKLLWLLRLYAILLLPARKACLREVSAGHEREQDD